MKPRIPKLNYTNILFSEYPCINYNAPFRWKNIFIILCNYYSSNLQQYKHVAFKSRFDIRNNQNVCYLLKSGFTYETSNGKADFGTFHFSSHHSFSFLTCSSSLGVKSFLMLNVLRMSSGVLPLIMLATVLHVTSNKPCNVDKLNEQLLVNWRHFWTFRKNWKEFPPKLKPSFQLQHIF